MSKQIQRVFKSGKFDLNAARNLEQQLGLHRVVAEVLVRRGLQEPEAVQQWLAADTEHPLASFAGLTVATDLVLAHLQRGSKITVHGDFDVDGVCATALLVRALRELGGQNVNWFIPDRRADGYGLSSATVQRLSQQGTELLITVDCAITAVEEVQTARAIGLDVVVTDHHTPCADGKLPDCPLVHPRICNYPCADLCGTGVAYKLAQALYLAADKDATQLEQDLDLVALATIADLVPLQDENRSLVRRGLRALSQSQKLGLQALLRISKVTPQKVDAGAVGFRLAPRINAAGRLYRADAGVELLLTQSSERATEIARELDAYNSERRDTEHAILFAAEAQVAELGDRFGYVVAGVGWHPGVVGIVASRLVEQHHRPAVVIALTADKGVGSGRSISGFDLLGALNANATYLTRYGGHRVAAGLELQPEQVEAFREAFEAHCAANLSAEDLVQSERVDAVVSGQELTLELVEALAALEPFGMGNPGVNLLVSGAQFRDPRPLGQDGQHVRFTLDSGAVRSPAVAFRQPGGKLPVACESAVDATFRLQRNEWQGVVEPQLVLRYARQQETTELHDLDTVRAGCYRQRLLTQFNALNNQAAGVALLDAKWCSVLNEHGLRKLLITLYQALRANSRAAGIDLELILQRSLPIAVSPELAASLLLVLCDLEVVTLNAADFSVALVKTERTELASSSTYRALNRYLEEQEQLTKPLTVTTS